MVFWKDLWEKIKRKNDNSTKEKNTLDSRVCGSMSLTEPQLFELLDIWQKYDEAILVSVILVNLATKGYSAPRASDIVRQAINLGILYIEQLHPFLRVALSDVGEKQWKRLFTD